MKDGFIIAYDGYKQEITRDKNEQRKHLEAKAAFGEACYNEMQQEQQQEGNDSNIFAHKVTFGQYDDEDEEVPSQANKRVKRAHSIDKKAIKASVFDRMQEVMGNH